MATRVSPAFKAAMDAWRDDQPDPKPTQAEALKLTLTDWLTRTGYLRPAGDPEMVRWSDQASACIAARRSPAASAVTGLLK